MLALTPADFDFERGTVKINKTYQRLNGRDMITPPKTKQSNRTIQMPEFLCEEMKEFFGMQYGLKKKDRIFTINKSYLHREMDRGAKAAGVKRIRIHDLRHSHIYVVLGLMIAVIGGTMIEKLHLENEVEEFIRKGKNVDIPQDKLTITDRLQYAWEQVVSTAKKVAPYVLVGVGIGAFIHNWIPEEFIVKVLGTGNPLGVVIATVAGVPMYADIFGTIPIAEALLAKGAQLGVVLSFMMGVTTLSLPSMIMLRKAVKPKLLGIFVTVCTIGIILVGYFFNAIQYIII